MPLSVIFHIVTISFWRRFSLLNPHNCPAHPLVADKVCPFDEDLTLYTYNIERLTMGMDHSTFFKCQLWKSLHVLQILKKYILVM